MSTSLNIRRSWSIREGVADQHGVVAFGAGREHRHRGADEFLQAADVLDRRGRQLRPGTGTAGAFLPTLGALVYRLDFGLRGGTGRHVVVRLAAVAVGGAD